MLRLRKAVPSGLRRSVLNADRGSMRRLPSIHSHSTSGLERYPSEKSCLRKHNRGADLRLAGSWTWVRCLRTHRADLGNSRGDLLRRVSRTYFYPGAREFRGQESYNPFAASRTIDVSNNALGAMLLASGLLLARSSRIVFMPSSNG